MFTRIRKGAAVLAVTVIAIVAAAAGVAIATNEFNYANCTPSGTLANCGTCIYGVMYDPTTCPSSNYDCITYGGSNSGVSFFACVPNTSSTALCQYIPVNPPITTCGSGSYWFCCCRSQLTGDCSCATSCGTCTGTATGAISTFTINSIC